MNISSDAAFQETWEDLEARYFGGKPEYRSLHPYDKVFVRELAKSFWLQGRLHQVERERARL